MTNHFPPDEFDAWAVRYDESVYSNGKCFPFDGYSQLLQTIAKIADSQPGASVLDLGIGTGNLSQLFAERGCEIWGVDFSSEMLRFARTKLPVATLAQSDIRTELQPAFQRSFDYIVSAYTFHHFPLEEKAELIQHLLKRHLLPGGKVIIGDVAFKNAVEEDVFRRRLGSKWEQEYYWLVDETLTVFAAVDIPARFIKISRCAGIFCFCHQE